MNNFRCKPIYLKYPIFQTIYIILWVPLGFIASWLLYIGIIKIIYLITSAILNLLFPVAFKFFAPSSEYLIGIYIMFCCITAFVYDLILLEVGLELIKHFLNKKNVDGGYDE